MTIRRWTAALLVLFMLAFGARQAGAVLPDEVLADPVLEARARGLSSELRCLVCQNQSIDDSDAELARDLRVLVRERIAVGDTDAEVLDYVVSRYGEFVLLRPRFNLRNALLWGTPLILLIGGGMFVFLNVLRRKPPPDLAMTEEEKRAVGDVLGE